MKWKRMLGVVRIVVKPDQGLVAKMNETGNTAPDTDILVGKEPTTWQLAAQCRWGSFLVDNEMLSKV